MRRVSAVSNFLQAQSSAALAERRSTPRRDIDLVKQQERPLREKLHGGLDAEGTGIVWFTASRNECSRPWAFQWDDGVSEMRTLVEAGQESRNAATILSFSG